MRRKHFFLTLCLLAMSVLCFQFSVLTSHYYNVLRHFIQPVHRRYDDSNVTLQFIKLENTTKKARNETRQKPITQEKPSTDVKLNDTSNKDDSNENQTTVISRWRRRLSTDLLVTVPNMGRLGNWMFQYASLLGIALRNKMRPFVVPSNKLLKYFDLSFVENHNVKSRGWHGFQEKCYACYDNRTEKLPRRNVSMTKYYQSWKYFSDVQQLVRKEFQFKTHIQKSANEKFKKFIKNATKPIIGVHIRRTDMLRTTENKMGYTVAPPSYLDNAMRYMTSRFGNVTFLVASDDVGWCRQKFSKQRNIIVIDKGDAAVDMATLTMCDHMIMTVGTYSWWAAWLTNGHTVYYKDYPAPGKSISTGFTKQDHYLPNWVPLGA